MDKCGVCNRPILSPTGVGKKWGLVGEFPGRDELRGMPSLGPGYVFVGDSGRILSQELARHKKSTNDFLLTYLWGHHKVDDGAEYNWHVKRCISEIKNCEALLFMGTEVTQTFLEQNVMDISGTIVSCSIFPKAIIVACPTPAVLFHATLGEFRHALDVFFKAIK